MCHTEGFISLTHTHDLPVITGEVEKECRRLRAECVCGGGRWGGAGRLQEAGSSSSSAGMVLTVLSWPRVYFSWWHFSVMSLVCSLPIRVISSSRFAVLSLWWQTACALSEDTSPWILSIWPIFRAAPRTLQSVRTILSALASERKALESRMDCLSPLETKKASWIIATIRMWAESKPREVIAASRFTWQQSRKPLITLLLGSEILLCHLSDRTDAESNRQTCKKTDLAHKQGKKPTRWPRWNHWMNPPPKLTSLPIRVTGTFLSLALSLSWNTRSQHDSQRKTPQHTQPDNDQQPSVGYHLLVWLRVLFLGIFCWFGWLHAGLVLV